MNFKRSGRPTSIHMKKLLAAFSMAALCVSAFAAGADELFPNNKFRAYQTYEALGPAATIGGRAIYKGGRNWQIADLADFVNNMNVMIGRVILVSPHNGEYFLEMAITSSMSSGSEDGYFSANVCNPAIPHALRVNKVSGHNDNCLIVSHQTRSIYNQPVPGLQVIVRNSKSNWRLYEVRLFINLALVGFPNSTPEEWNSGGVEKDPARRQFVDNMEKWARALQSGVDSAIDYSKPAQAFGAVPDIETVFKPLTAPVGVAAVRYGKTPNTSIDYVYCPALERMIDSAQETCR
ncbi:hypothetical protein RQP54_19415 [Curvibacter sp. APW13]|uniref:hypothetical protein n=1 Tax=Curvibacter sp. APW13 TaxID=3077236 RepID=UPI0028DFE8EA|nr:hypothetical protein [Curvibacter sp. APW13]MDT8993051.1 hypothetical protein [Curvibacter sp. APW13]